MPEYGVLAGFLLLGILCSVGLGLVLIILFIGWLFPVDSLGRRLSNAARYEIAFFNTLTKRERDEYFRNRQRSVVHISCIPDPSGRVVGNVESVGAYFFRKHQEWVESLSPTERAEYDRAREEEEWEKSEREDHDRGVDEAFRWK